VPKLDNQKQLRSPIAEAGKR